MAIREVDAISNAIIETEREIAGDAWDVEDTERDEGGDRSLESMGEGLEGQQEAEDDDEADGDAEGDEGSEEDGEADEDEGEGEAEAAAAAAKAGEVTAPKPGEGQQQRTEGRVPSGKLREANERARLLQAELDALKADKGPAGELKALSEQLAAATRRIDDLSRGQTRQPPPAQEKQEPKEAPDIFEDPKAFVAHITEGFQTELNKRDQQLANVRLENSFAIAHAFHKDTFEKAFEGINKLDPRNPDDRATVQRIYSAPNPGEALVNWHKRQSTLAEVGDDPAAYRERVARETREALMKDPEFRKAIVAELRGEAQRGGADGEPRSETRLPRSLARAPGSNLGGQRVDQHARDDSEQSVAESAWR